MRKRHKRNPLLMRILIISALAHIPILYILAKTGELKRIQERLMVAKLINLPPPKAPSPRPKTAKAPVHKTVHKASKAKSKAPHPATAKPSGPPPPKVVASTGSSSGTGQSIVAPGVARQTGVVPVVPPGKPAGGPKVVAAKPSASPPPIATQPVAQSNQPAVVAQKTAPLTTNQPSAPAPVFVPASLVSDDQPAIPNGLRTKRLDAIFQAMVLVEADGGFTVTMTHSTGIRRLDRAALKAVQTWKFQPATLGGNPTVCRVPVQIEFKVQ